MTGEKIENIEKTRSLKNRGVLALFPQDYGGDFLGRQMEGERLLFLTSEDCEHLASRVSTDGILPTGAGEFQSAADLARFALSGFPGIKEGEMLAGDFGVLVVGPGFGGGSSREHAPLALNGAGIGVVVVVGGAERIFRENCDAFDGPLIIEVDDIGEVNAILAQAREGSIEFTEPYPDEIRPRIREGGGLFAFTRGRLEGRISLPPISHPELSSDRPMTAVEKILADKMVNVDLDYPIAIPGDVGFVRANLLLSHDFFTEMVVDSARTHFGDNFGDRLADKDLIHLFEDHLVFAPPRFRSLIEFQRRFAEEFGIRLYRREEGLEGSSGICHTMVIQEALLVPGQVGVGTDSHTCTAGALNAFAFGVGTTVMANAFLTGDVLVEVPETVRVNLRGELPVGSAAKDVALYLLADSRVRQGGAIGRVFEFGGEGLVDWPLDQQSVLTNMAVEGGATTGIIVEPTEALFAHLASRRDLSREEAMSMFVRSDPGARFARTMEIDLSQVEPMVALPHHPTKGVPISELSGKIKVTGGFVGSCTAGNLTDLKQTAGVVDGREVVVPLVVQPASMEIFEQAEREGILETIRRAGGKILLPGCGACIGMGPGGVESAGDIVISATNRNFPGRMGKAGGEIYLASPATVAASSVAGRICSCLEI